MDTQGLERRLIERWQEAAADLQIKVSAPVEMHDAAGRSFVCEALVHDFGSPNGAVVVSPRTERRVRASLRSMKGQLWVCRSEPRPSVYERKHVVDELLDWGWFGKEDAEPKWYSERMPRSA